MAFKTSYNAALGQPNFTLAAVDTVKAVAVGTIVKGYDDTLGEAEFIYLPGLAATVAGDMVAYDLNPAGPVTTRSLAATHANQGTPLAVAVAAVLLGQYGWYQISGVAAVNAIAATAAGRAFVSATAGQLTSVAAAGAQIIGARISTAVGTPAAGQVYLTLNRPATQSQIT